jgi:hypothetical protein
MRAKNKAILEADLLETNVVTTELTLEELKASFIKSTNSLDADKSSVIKYFLSIDNKEVLKTLTLSDFANIVTWEYILKNLNTVVSDDINNCSVSDDEIIIDYESNQVKKLLTQLPRIHSSETCIMVDALIGYDMLVALDGIHFTGEQKNTKYGRIKFNYGLGKIVIPTKNKQYIILGMLTQDVNEQKNCFIPSNVDIDNLLCEKLLNSKKPNIYKLAKNKAIASWDYNQSAMKQVNKLRDLTEMRSRRSDYYKLVNSIEAN